MTINFVKFLLEHLIQQIHWKAEEPFINYVKKSRIRDLRFSFSKMSIKNLPFFKTPPIFKSKKNPSQNSRNSPQRNPFCLLLIFSMLFLWSILYHAKKNTLENLCLLNNFKIMIFGTTSCLFLIFKDKQKVSKFSELNFTRKIFFWIFNRCLVIYWIFRKWLRKNWYYDRISYWFFL
jgi:hypothetical protein